MCVFTQSSCIQMLHLISGLSEVCKALQNETACSEKLLQMFRKLCTYSLHGSPSLKYLKPFCSLFTCCASPLPAIAELLDNAVDEVRQTTFFFQLRNWEKIFSCKQRTTECTMLGSRFHSDKWLYLQIANGATYVRIDKIANPRDETACLLIQGSLPAFPLFCVIQRNFGTIDLFLHE